MIENAIKEIPEDQWRKGEHQNLVPVVCLLHIIETADFYTGNPAQFKWGDIFKVSWDKDNPEDFPSKEELMDYYIQVKTKTEDWVNSFSDEEFLGVDPFFQHTGQGVLGRALYLLSHMRQHLGELNAELRHRDLPRVKWR